MRFIKLPLRDHHNPDRKVTEYITLGLSDSNNLAITEVTAGNGEDYCCLRDGLHNNGGWPIKMTSEELTNKLRELFE